MQTPVRPTIKNSEWNECTSDFKSCKKTTEKQLCARKSWTNTPDQGRRLSQREKQISYGYATTGYLNMIELVNNDPLLKSGGILPLPPPVSNIGSKRTWDVLVRKWRRALHMFDFVFIDGKDENSKSLESVVEAQRLQWVSSAFHSKGKDHRKRFSIDEIMEVRKSPYVPTRLPVEENLKFILRSEECYEPVSNVVPPTASSLTKGTDISFLDAGIKIHVAPSTVNQSVSSPVKCANQLFHETPQVEKSGIEIHSSERTPSSELVLSSPQTSQKCGGNFSGHRAGAYWNNNVPFDLTYDSPFVPSTQSAQRNSSVFPTPLQNDYPFVVSSCIPSNMQGPFISPTNVNRTHTPATAPKRITILQSTGSTRKIGEALPRILFPHSAASFTSSANQPSQTCPGVLTNELHREGGGLLKGGENQDRVDLVSQQLFPDK